MVNAKRLKEVIEGSGISYKENAASFIFNCPKCGKKDKCYIRKSDGVFKCFSCEERNKFRGGKTEFALAALFGVPLQVAFEQLYQIRNDYLIRLEPEEEIELKDESFLEVTPDSDYFSIDHELSIEGLEYLQSRGITLEAAVHFQLMFSYSHKRVIFPCYMGDTLVGWQGRTILPDITGNQKHGKIPNERIKILGSPGLPRERVLMFWNLAQRSEHVVLCEGPVDAVKTYLIGGGVASMGKSLSPKQVELLINHPAKRIYLALDPDAYLETEKLAKWLKRYKEVYELEITKKDIGEMSFEEVKESFDKAQPINTNKLFIYLK